MTYDIAINKAWEDTIALSKDEIISVKFLGDEYTVNLKEKKVMSLSCNVAAKDFTAILILHYLIQKIKGLKPLTGEWVSFKELPTGESYYPSFKTRAIEPLIRKYGRHPEGILEVLNRLPAKRIGQGDIGIVIEAFAGIPILITLWRSDDEFGPEANMLFDKSIADILCTEDVVVLAGIVANQL